MSNTRKGFALRAFTNAGTKQSFAGGKVYEFSVGDFANYRAAGLIRDPSAAERKASDSSAADPKKAGADDA